MRCRYDDECTRYASREAKNSQKWPIFEIRRMYGAPQTCFVDWTSCPRPTLLNTSPYLHAWEFISRSLKSRGNSKKPDQKWPKKGIWIFRSSIRASCSQYGYLVVLFVMENSCIEILAKRWYIERDLKKLLKWEVINTRLGNRTHSGTTGTLMIWIIVTPRLHYILMHINFYIL